MWRRIFDIVLAPMRAMLALMQWGTASRRLLSITLPARVAVMVAIFLVICAIAAYAVFYNTPNRTSWDYWVSPLRLAIIALLVIVRLQLRCLSSEMPMAKLTIQRLRFFLKGQAQHVFPLYELIFNNTLGIALANSPADPQPLLLDKRSLQAVGFERDQGMLPYRARSFLGYDTRRADTEGMGPDPIGNIRFPVAVSTTKTLPATWPQAACTSRYAGYQHFYQQPPLGSQETGKGARPG
jgi:hypothetical protein